MSAFEGEVPMTKTIALVLVSVLAAPSMSVLAQSVDDGQRAPIVQAMSDSASSSALRQSITREAARLAKRELDATTFQQQQPPQRTWAGRHPVALGAMIGAGGGAVGAAAYCGGSKDCDGMGPLLMALNAGVCAGIGMAIGAVVSLIRH